MASPIILQLLTIGLLHFVSQTAGRTQRVLASPDIPLTAFSCIGRPVGYYADLETNCRVYHMCGEGERQYSYMCPNTTLFHQRMLVCAHWYQVNCSRSEQDYSANLLIGQRDKPFVPDYFIGLGEDGVDVEKENDLQQLAQRRQSFSYPTTQLSSEVTEKEPHGFDLQGASSGSLFGSGGRRNNFIPGQQVEKEDRTTQVAVTSRPTNVSFRSTIETPSSDFTIAHTQPMTSPPSPTLRTILQPRKPSLELEPPVNSIEETETVELRLEDPRRALFIPEDNARFPPQGEPIIVRLRVRARDHSNSAHPCQNCLSSFLVDLKNCTPCIRAR